MHFYSGIRLYPFTIFFLFALATLDLIGWELDIRRLTRLAISMPPMNIFTACCFILNAFALINIRCCCNKTWYRVFNVLLALSIACLSGFSLFTNLGLWSAAWVDMLSVNTESAIISSPVTSLTFLLSAFAIGILATKLKARHKISQYCALIMMAMVLLILISYLSQAIIIYQFKQNIGVAIPTFIGLFFLSSALFFAFPQMALAEYLLQQSTAAAAQRQLLPATVFIPLLTFVVSPVLEYIGIIYDEATIDTISNFVIILLLVSFTVLLRKYISNTEKQFDIMANSAPVMMWMADSKGQTFFFNKQWLSFTGRNLTDEINVDFEDCVYSDDRMRTHAVYSKAFTQKKAFTLEYRLKYHDNDYRTILEQGAPYWDVNGLFKGFIGSCVDISKNKELQSTLESKNLLLSKEIIQRKRLEQEQYQRNKILECLATGKSLPVILDKIINAIEIMNLEMLASILLFDERHQCLHHGAAPSLPDFYIKAIDGVKIGNGVGSCSSTTFTRRAVIVEDVLTHPYWSDYTDLTIRAGFRACYSTPVFSSKGDLLAVFAIYYKKPHRPTSDEKDIVDKMAHLAAIAIERKQDESELRIAAQAFQSHEAVLVTDSDHNILRVNSAFSRITGYTAAEVIGKNPRILSSGRQDNAFYQAMYDELTHNGAWENEIWNRRKDGSIYPEWLSITCVKNSENKITHYVAVFSDITDKKNAEEEIYNLAFYDPLTTLANRRLLLDRLKQEIVVAKRHQQYGSIIFFDLDKFKILNDSLGHQAGDELLKQVAQRIKSVIREEDTACRLGGDEFVVLISCHESDLSRASEQTMIVAEKIRHVINQPFILEAGEYNVSASIGITLFPELSKQAETILQHADTAMYQSKANGRNTIHFFQPSMQEQANYRALMEKELKIAIKEKQFILHYQPQIDQQGKIISAEALIRWQHPVKGIVSPGEFISIAEDSQLILAIGQWVIRQACEQIVNWESQGQQLNHISVNVSPKQFRQDDFVSQVKRIIEETGIKANELMLELTENILIDDIDDTVNKMYQLNKCGVTFSIDDFGTGYSSLAYLKQLPLKELKIDQGFIRDILIDANDAVIVETIISMARSLKLDVIAEGIEREEQLTFLNEKKCPAFQGFYFGRPVDSDDFFALFGE